MRWRSEAGPKSHQKTYVHPKAGIRIVMNSVIHNKTPRPNPKLERGGVQGGCKPVPRDRNFLCEDRGRLRHLSSVRFRRMAMRWARVGQALKSEISNNVIFASAVVCLKGPGESGNAPKYLSRFRANRFDTQLLPNLHGCKEKENLFCSFFLGPGHARPGSFFQVPALFLGQGLPRTAKSWPRMPPERPWEYHFEVSGSLRDFLLLFFFF